jgi:hypothetical protein
MVCAAETRQQTIQRQLQEQVQSQDLFQIKLLLAVLGVVVLLIENPVDLAALAVQLEDNQVADLVAPRVRTVSTLLQEVVLVEVAAVVDFLI